MLTAVFIVLMLVVASWCPLGRLVRWYTAPDANALDETQEILLHRYTWPDELDLVSITVMEEARVQVARDAAVRMFRTMLACAAVTAVVGLMIAAAVVYL